MGEGELEVRGRIAGVGHSQAQSQALLLHADGERCPQRRRRQLQLGHEAAIALGPCISQEEVTAAGIAPVLHFHQEQADALGVENHLALSKLIAQRDQSQPLTEGEPARQASVAQHKGVLFRGAGGLPVNGGTGRRRDGGAHVRVLRPRAQAHPGRQCYPRKPGPLLPGHDVQARRMQLPSRGQGQLRRGLRRRRLSGFVEPRHLHGSVGLHRGLQRPQVIEGFGVPLDTGALARGQRQACGIGPHIPGAGVEDQPRRVVQRLLRSRSPDRFSLQLPGEQVQPHHVLPVASGDGELVLGPVALREAHEAIPPPAAVVDGEIDVVIVLVAWRLADDDLVGSGGEPVLRQLEVVPVAGCSGALLEHGSPAVGAVRVHRAVDDDLEGLVEAIGLWQVVPGVVTDHEADREPHRPHLLPHLGRHVGQVQNLLGLVAGGVLVGDAGAKIAAPHAGIVEHDPDPVLHGAKQRGDGEGREREQEDERKRDQGAAHGTATSEASQT